MVREVFDHYDDQFDQTLEWTYDEVGNRLTQNLDKGNDSVIDELTRYYYDANDRLIDELFDGQNDGTFEKTTTYGYDKTQQTAKTVTENGVITSDSTFEYNAVGQMSVVTITKYTDGVASSIERTTYAYGSDGIRVSALQEIDSNADGTYETATLTEYLNDPNNHIGYSQVLKTTEYSIDGEIRTITKEIYYTIGLDQIAQSITAYIDGIAQDTEHHYFTYDGHGSTRALLDITAAIIQLYSFDAYGNAIDFNTTEALTEYLYSGEQFDSKIEQQYLRARYYDPATGRFNSLDSFFGNLDDPQSLHKYLYTHADPISGIDPNGLTLVSVISCIAIGTVLTSIGNEVVSILEKITIPFGGYRGGYSAYSEIHTLLEEVKLYYDRLQDNQKSQLIKHLHTSPLNGWDISDMIFSKKHLWTDNVEGGVFATLTYGGSVYPVADVNYILWGYIHGLAFADNSIPSAVQKEFHKSASIDSTVAYVYAYRGVFGGYLALGMHFQSLIYTITRAPVYKVDIPAYETIMGKVSWARYGWELATWKLGLSLSTPSFKDAPQHPGRSSELVFALSNQTSFKSQYNRTLTWRFGYQE